MITKHCKLDTHQLLALDKLCLDCQNTDGNTVPTYQYLLSEARSLPYTLLYYSEKKLVGVLSIFFFYEEACEISLMVSPSFRKQGIARHLLKEILAFIVEPQIKTLIFPIPYQFYHNHLIHYGFSYQHSEFQMHRISEELLPFDKEKITVRPASKDDITSLNLLDSACFSSYKPAMEERFKELLQNKSYRLFIAYKDNKPIGKAHIHIEQNTARFSDIAILPALQGQGLGSALLAFCINTCLEKNITHIILDVETMNKNALSLYIRLGFVTKNAYDFWSIPKINLLELILK